MSRQWWCLLGFEFLSLFASTCCQCGYIPLKLRAESYSTDLEYSRNIADTRDGKCDWLIQTEYVDHVIEMTVEQLDLYSRNCEEEFVIIYDGPSTDGAILARLCGGETSGPGRTLVSTGQEVRVHYSSKPVLIAPSYFMLAYRAVPKKDFHTPSSHRTLLATLGSSVALLAIVGGCCFYWRRVAGVCCSRRPSHTTSTSNTPDGPEEPPDSPVAVSELPTSLSNGTIPPDFETEESRRGANERTRDSPPRYGDLFLEGQISMEPSGSVRHGLASANPCPSLPEAAMTTAVPESRASISNNGHTSGAANREISGLPPSYSQSQITEKFDSSELPQDMTTLSDVRRDQSERPRVLFSLRSTSEEQTVIELEGRGENSQSELAAESSFTPPPKYDDSMVVSFPPELDSTSVVSGRVHRPSPVD